MPQIAKAKKEAKRAIDEQRRYDLTLQASRNEALRTQNTRVAVMLMAFVQVMHYELHVPQEKLRKLPDYIDELDWFLNHDIGPNGTILDRPMFKLTDTLPQIRREKKGYIVKVRTAWDMADEIQVAIVRALVGVELKLIWIVCTEFPGIGKVKLGYLQDRMHELEKNMTFQEAVELKAKLKRDLKFTFEDFDEFGENTFGQWVWNKDYQGPSLKDAIVAAVKGGACG